MATQLKLRARSRDGYYQDIDFDLSILQRDPAFPINAPIRYKAEVEGIDISARISQASVVFKNALEAVSLNRLIVGKCGIPLRNNDGFFRYDLENNFWKANNLNPSGFLNAIKVFVEYLNDGHWEPVLFFEGYITGVQTPLKKIATLICYANAMRIQQIDLEGAGVGIKKILQLDAVSEDPEQPVSEGTYSAETGLAPLNVSDKAAAYHHQDVITLKEVINHALGTKDKTGHLSATDFKAQGGYLGDPILLKGKTPYRYKDAKNALEHLTKIDSFLTTLYPDFEDLPEVEPHISVKSNIQYNTEPGRITRLPVDWVFDERQNRRYVLLSNPVSYIPDQLVEYREDTDSYHILREFEPSEVAHQLTTLDDDTFYILFAPGVDRDLSDPTSQRTETEVLRLDASIAPSQIKVMQYKKSSDWLETFIDSDDPYRPQLGIHYHVGFPTRDFAWQGIVPSRHSTFKAESGYIYYRYATENEFGVARADLNGNTAALFTAEKDSYENHLNFAFTLDNDDTVYFAYVVGTPNRSTLFIDKYDGTEAQRIAEISRGISEINDLDNNGGAFLGIHEMVYADEFLYMLVPVARGNRDIDKSAGVVLYRYGIQTLTLEKIDAADFVHYGFAGLTVHSETEDSVHDNAVYYTQAPVECYKYPAYNPDLDTYDPETDENYLPDFKGSLKRVLPTGAVQDCGTIRFDAQGAFRGLLCRPLSTDDGLHLIVAKDSPDALLQKDSVASLPSNALWCVYSRKLHFTLNQVPVDGTLEAALTEIATLVNATLGVDRNITIVENRLPVGGLLDGDIVETSPTLSIKNANREKLPDAGHVLVDGEVIAFGKRYNSQLAEIQRGRILTTPSIHIDNSEVVFLDKVISPKHLKGDINWSVDTQHLYNTIKDEKQLIRIKDILSPFRENVHTLDTDLDSLRIPWLEMLAGSYLHRLKELRFLLNFSLAPAFRLKIGDILGFYYADPIPPIALKILDIEYHKDTTKITGREVKADIDVALESITGDINDTYRLLDPVGEHVLISGDGSHIQYIGHESEADIVPLIFEHDIDDMRFLQYQKVGPIRMPKALGGAGDYQYTMTGLPDNMFFDPINLAFYGAPDDAQPASPVTYTVYDRKGTIHRKSFNITVDPAPKDIQRIVDATGEPLLVTGDGTHIIFSGD